MSSCCIRTDGQTERYDEANFGNAHKRGYSVVVVLSGIRFVPSLMTNFLLGSGSMWA
jgi:hypothetical protein